jgi:hypothetical protein
MTKKEFGEEMAGTACRIYGTKHSLVPTREIIIASINKKTISNLQI